LLGGVLIKSEKLTLSQELARFMAVKKVPVAFQLSGGMIAFMLDAIQELGQTPIVNCRHEQAAGFGAEGATRVSGRPSFAFGTSGPGATNLITAIASCFFDSVPVVFVTGQVNQKESKKNPTQRQNGFQELDICSAVKHITKYSAQPRSAEDAMLAIKNGWTIAQQGRPGPVLIDIAINLQQDIVCEVKTDLEADFFENKFDSNLYEQLRLVINSSKNPLILAGGGVRIDNSIELLQQFSEKYNIPYVSSLMGLDSVNHNDEKYFGFIGSYGNRWANQAMQKSDLLIALGSRMDVRQTGNNVSRFTNGKQIIRVDIDENELSGRINADFKIKSTISDFLKKMLEIDISRRSNDFINEIALLRKTRPQEVENSKSIGFNPNTIVSQIPSMFPQTKGYIVDVGQHQMWAAQSLPMNFGQRFITSGGLGAMGFSIPASLGAASVDKSRWVVIVGDGCLQLSSAELQTLIHYEVPIAICLFNNHQHGMVAQFQEENMSSRFVGTRQGYSCPDFIKLAEVYGFKKTYRVTTFAEYDSIVKESSSWGMQPVFIEFVISQDSKALPKMSIDD